jgi:hypothetical protein
LKSWNGLWQKKNKKSRLNNYSKKFLSSVHWKVGQQEKGSGNRTIIGQRGRRNGLRQEEEKKV